MIGRLRHEMRNWEILELDNADSFLWCYRVTKLHKKAADSQIRVQSENLWRNKSLDLRLFEKLASILYAINDIDRRRQTVIFSHINDPVFPFEFEIGAEV